jgi:nitrilase
MTGFHYDGKGTQKATYGHSLICDPWGNVVAQASDGEGFTTGRLDQAVTAKVRADIQIELHHRLPFGDLS